MSTFNFFRKKQPSQLREPGLQNHVDIICQKIMSLPQINLLRMKITDFDVTESDNTIHPYRYYYEVIGETFKTLNDKIISKKEIGSCLMELLAKLNRLIQKTTDIAVKELGYKLCKEIAKIKKEVITWEPILPKTIHQQMLDYYFTAMCNTDDSKTVVDWTRGNKFYINHRPYDQTIQRSVMNAPTSELKLNQINQFIQQCGFDDIRSNFISRNLQQEGVLGVVQQLVLSIGLAADMHITVIDSGQGHYAFTGNNQCLTYKALHTMNIQSVEACTQYPDAFSFEICIEFEWLKPNDQLPIIKTFTIKTNKKPIYLAESNIYLPALVESVLPEKGYEPLLAKHRQQHLKKKN